LRFRDHLIHRVRHRASKRGYARQVVNGGGLEDLKKPGRVRRQSPREPYYIPDGLSPKPFTRLKPGFSIDWSWN
jgi:hypothetical protein